MRGGKRLALEKVAVLLADALGEDGVLVGGLAVGAHGYVRATKDVDIVPAPDSANLKPDPLDPEVLEQGGNWVLRTQLGRVDIMQWIGDDALWGKLAPAAVEANVDGLAFRVVSYDDLVALKEIAGRPEDLMDLQRLRQARGEE